MSDKPGLPLGEAIMKGLMIGGAVGIMASWFLSMETSRAMYLGFVSGLLAGVTAWRMAIRRGK